MVYLNFDILGRNASVREACPCLRVFLMVTIVSKLSYSLITLEMWASKIVIVYFCPQHSNGRRPVGLKCELAQYHGHHMTCTSIRNK